MSEHTYLTGDFVRHSQFGNGKIEFDKGLSAIVRFDHGLEEVKKEDLERFSSPVQSLKKPLWDSPLQVFTRSLAASILSVNDAWGVFSRSKIDLLPHQLWVCRRVNETWPTRWLVADDVGLGKTIEAGLILWPLLARGTVKRLLILCPASLVEQWQYRLREMFDIRMVRYLTEVDTAKSDFWNTNNQVVASFHTLRDDYKGRHERIFESEPWDLVIVDEAHHLNADENSGPTLIYKLLSRMQEERLVDSMVFFTGTPHRGKNFGFLALLKILRPELFDPRKELQSQLSSLRHVLIRNNKQSVTDIKGNKLFYPPIVNSETYTYSEQEEIFYNMLTNFISTGKMYAKGLGSTNGRAVMLVLIAMQKLASSSVAAIRKALKGRLSRIVQSQERLNDLHAELLKYEFWELNDNDTLSKMEEEIAIKTAALRLMEDEIPRLKELITVAERVEEETKIKKIVSILQTRFVNKSVLFFTEYKATQSLLISKLYDEFGDHCATFINGDDRADDIIDSTGKILTLTEQREAAAERFNQGQVRFIVATEAGGEGIDLQENCHSLIHVDLPWNPMRLHQRVGRLNRYGQNHQVEVVNLRNPDTVESRIWEKLNQKIENIMEALGSAMDEPEDLLQLVLGMESPTLFREIFSDASGISPDSLSRWFDMKTASFGGQDAIKTVQDIVGNCAKFDFHQISPQIPRIDLPALQPFFEGMLTLNGRRIFKDETKLSFKTPEVWLDDPAIRFSYENMVFERKVRGPDMAKKVLGVGHKVVDQALKQAIDGTACLATIKTTKLKSPLVLFKVYDSITGERKIIRNKIIAVTADETGADGIRIFYDWEVINKLNEVYVGKEIKTDPSAPSTNIDKIIVLIKSGLEIINTKIHELDVPFKQPEVEVFSVFCPI